MKRPAVLIAARLTKWRIHERGQLLLCQEGVVARTQVRGHPMQELNPDDSAYVPGGVPYWSGAGPTQSATLFSVDLTDGQTRWLSPVTEAEYKTAPGQSPQR
jgi:hypothetical protein